PFSPTLYLTFPRPADYGLKERDRFSGKWTGPSYTGPDANRGPATIAWDLTLFDNRNPPGARTAGQALQQASVHHWPAFHREAVAIPHFVGGRKVGTIPAVIALTGPGTAELE